MSEKVIQCCYSNVVSETGSAGGWQVTAASEGIPAQIREEYGKIQNSNVASQVPRGADGNPLNLFEIVIQKGYLMLTRVAYGLKDSGGRHNNMLSHSFLFEMNETVLSDPNIFLTVKDDNFTDDIEKARQIPAEFQRSEPYTLETAMELCGLDKDKYVRLIYAMHIQKENKRPLYIHSSGGESVIRPFIYCIWKGMPLSMRRSFSCASAVVNPNSVRTVLFSSEHGAGELFYDLDSGESNVLDPRSVKKYKRWGFVDYVAENFDHMDGEQYFRQLEEATIRLGDAKAAKAKVLKIAHQIITEPDEAEMTFEELQRNLFDALSAPVEHNDYIDTYICSVLKKINDEERLLDSDAAEEALLERLKEKNIPELKEAGEVYLLRKISKSSVEEGAGLLGQLSEQQFDRFCVQLQQTEGGSEYIDYYYENHFPEKLSWAVLDAYLDEIGEHCDALYPRTKKRLQQVSKALYLKELEGQGVKTEAYEKYTGFCAVIASSSEEEQEIPLNAKNMYWDHFSMERFSFKNQQEYAFFLTEDHPVCQSVKLLCFIMRNMKVSSTDKIMHDMNLLLTRYQTIFTEETRQKLYENILEYINGASLSNRELYVNLFYLMMTLGNADFWKSYEDYAGMLASGEMEDFVDVYGEELKKIKSGRKQEEEKLIRTYNIAFFQYLKQENRLDDVTIDVVLAVGESMYENPFDILENLSLYSSKLYRLLENTAESIVEESVLLSKEEYIACAEEFIHEDSQYRLVVKDWLSEAKRQMKKSSRRGEGDVKPALGGFMSKIIPRSDSEDDGEDDEEKPRKKWGGLFGGRR